MDYKAWAQEYYDTIEQIDAVLNKLKSEQAALKRKGRKNPGINKRIIYWRGIRKECAETADSLMMWYRRLLHEN